MEQTHDILQKVAPKELARMTKQEKVRQFNNELKIIEPDNKMETDEINDLMWDVSVKLCTLLCKLRKLKDEKSEDKIKEDVRA